MQIQRIEIGGNEYFIDCEGGILYKDENGNIHFSTEAARDGIDETAEIVKQAFAAGYAAGMKAEKPPKVVDTKARIRGTLSPAYQAKVNKLIERREKLAAIPCPF